MSGSATGAVGTNWYSLQLSSTLNISPMGGDYASVHAQGDKYSEKLKPLMDDIEKIILEARSKFNAPMEEKDAFKMGDSIYGVIIEDEMEFDPTLNIHYLGLTEEDKKERLLSEQEDYKAIKSKEFENAAHCSKYFEKNSLQSISFTGEQPNNFLEYHVTLWVSSRIKRSTLNWIKKQLHPLIMKSFPEN